ncbi:DUF2971 domain-containing protein [Sinorhizobium fredii]|uniref:DUF2971 domain-containing protein n=1 Tax=Rhizobium fredii TaxID=380 RepID=UPI003514B06F
MLTITTSSRNKKRTNMKPICVFADQTRLNPPATLFKYLAPERSIDVLEYGTAKFTQMANTNDIFEVRKTFERIAGPRFIELIEGLKSEIVSKKSLDLKLDEKLKNHPDVKLSRHLRRKAKKIAIKDGLYKRLSSEINNQAELFTQHMNSEEASEMFLDMVGKDMLCFSLSESYDIAPMWAHYADNQKGFVIAFKTDHSWFKNRNDYSKTRLHKVTYFDGIVDEFLENPEAAFGSKTTHWSYEREWRMYCGMKDIEKTIPSTPDPIHLVTFPPDLVESIIIGARASRDHF